MEIEKSVWENVFAGLGVSPETVLQKINKHLSQRKPLFAAVAEHLGGDLRGKTIVEVGAGTAIECLLFALRGARCCAVDFEKRAVHYARETASLFSLRPYLSVGDGFVLPVKSGCADLVLSQGFLEHFKAPEREALLREQIRILKPEGMVLVDVPNFYSPYEAYKRLNGLFGGWIYGKEEGIKKGRLAAMAGACGLELIHSYGWSFRGYPHKSFADFSYMLPLLVLRNTLRIFGYGHDSIGLLFRRKS